MNRLTAWRLAAAVLAVLLVAALVLTALAGRSFFGPGVPTPAPSAWRAADPADPADTSDEFRANARFRAA